MLQLRARFWTLCIIALSLAACSHGSGSNTANANSSTVQQQSSAGSAAGGSNPGPVAPASASDGRRLADIAVQRLGGAKGPNPPVVTGVSVVGNYGLTVYTIGTSSQELLSIKERGGWRPLGTDAYSPDGRGLIHFGISPELAARLIARLQPPPSR